ncbi:PrgI family protein [Enterococcus faecalis]|uniref:PrgI family protein n=1 Tax=Enterococcus faecalis TaxID=1351 RepID=UPI001A976D23|nr:PrgI family protein [Enterococcus faecalis]MBO1137171.1 PrgI family protein [Enterococcus faecalis]MDN3202059.1 PrgI family protein [Enterococcus faecalis]
MEIKVFKDLSRREKTYIGLLPRQLFFVGMLFLFLILDVVNILYNVLPVFMLRLIMLPLVGISMCNAIVRPHGLKFSTWLKLYFKFQTTIQIRTYQKENERIKKYDAKDFKKNKKIKESQR